MNIIYPNLQDLNNSVLGGMELQRQILASEDSKEGGKTKIVFRPHLLLRNGGFFKDENCKYYLLRYIAQTSGAR